MRDFEEVFGRTAQVERSAPGRVNLIGDHTDYSGGWVLPMAIPQRTHVALAATGLCRVRVASGSLGQLEEFELGSERRRGTFVDYVQGIVVALRARGFEVGGFEAFVRSDVPIGSGLASSAALEVSLLHALRDGFRLPIGDVEVAQIGRASETDFVGAPTGIMDQMASSLADVDHALFLDTTTLAYERIPLPSAVEVVVVDSGLPHDHATGGYARRRAECELAARLLGVRTLREVEDPSRWAQLPDPISRRARHVLRENARVLEAVDCMRAENVTRLGRLLDESHASLRDDYEVSVPELDRLVAIAQRQPDVLGARMTGGGFGGAIVALAERGRGAAAARRIVAQYGADGGRARALVPEEATG